MVWYKMMNTIPYYRGVEAQTKDREKKGNHWIWSSGGCDARKAEKDVVKKVMTVINLQIG